MGRERIKGGRWGKPLQKASNEPVYDDIELVWGVQVMIFFFIYLFLLLIIRRVGSKHCCSNDTSVFFIFKKIGREFPTFYDVKWRRSLKEKLEKG